MELIEKDNMITAWGTKDGVATVIGVDFGHKNDYAVKTVLKKHPDGRFEVVSSEPIGRTIDFNDPARRQKVIDEVGGWNVVKRKQINLPQKNGKIDFICIDWISACLGVLQNVF